MIHRSKLAAIALSGMVAIAPLAGAAWAIETGSATARAENSAQNAETAKPSELMKTSEEVFGALRDVRSARMAIFNGDIDQASSLVANASRGFDAADARIAALGIRNPKDDADNVTYVPFQMAMGVAEDFVPSEDTAAPLQQANEHLAKGDQKQAAEVLKSADIDVTVTAAMAPIDQSVAKTKDAAALIRDGKYYEANLALKDIEDSIVVEAYAIDAIPSQGGARS